jgi:hypothetical protein
MTATHTSTASKFLIMTCFYILLAPINTPAGSPVTARLVDAASTRFSDVKMLCGQKPKLCESAAGLAASAGEGLQRIYDWALHDDHA